MNLHAVKIITTVKLWWQVGAGNHLPPQMLTLTKSMLLLFSACTPTQVSALFCGMLVIASHSLLLAAM